MIVIHSGFTVNQAGRAYGIGFNMIYFPGIMNSAVHLEQRTQRAEVAVGSLENQSNPSPESQK